MASNALCKAIVDEAVAAEQLGADVVAKAYGKAVSDLVVVGEGVASIVANVGSAKAEAEALLADPASDADLVAYIGSKVSGQAPVVQDTIVAVADLILSGTQKVDAVVLALQGKGPASLAAASPPPAPAA